MCLTVFIIIFTTHGQEKIEKVKSKQLQVLANITVQAPNGGESWEMGERYSIRWTSKGLQGTVKIMLKMPGRWFEIARNLPVETKNYSYTVPGNLPAGTKYRVYVMTPDEKVKDESDKYFSIVKREIRVLRPNGGETLLQGTECDIRWLSGGQIGRVIIDVEDEKGVKHRVCETRNTNSYHWRIPTGLRPETYKLIITSRDGKTRDESNGRFDIAPPEVELTCGFLEYGKFRKKMDFVVASAKSTRLKFEVFVENKGTKILNRVPFMWTILKQPLNEVVVQGEAGFGNVYPNRRYSTTFEYKYYKKARVWFFSSSKKKFEKGLYLFVFEVDPRKELPEPEWAWENNKCEATFDIK